MEKKEKVESISGEKALKKTASSAIIKKVKNGENTDDQRHLKVKKMVMTPALIASVVAAIEEDHWLSIKAVATAHGTPFPPFTLCFKEDLGLEKKSPRFVLRLLSDIQKQQHVVVCSVFVAVVHRCLLPCWINRDHGSDEDVLPRPSDKKAIPAVDQEWAVGPNKGQGPGQPN